MTKVNHCWKTAAQESWQNHQQDLLAQGLMAFLQVTTQHISDQNILPPLHSTCLTYNELDGFCLIAHGYQSTSKACKQLFWWVQYKLSNATGYLSTLPWRNTSWCDGFGWDGLCFHHSGGLCFGFVLKTALIPQECFWYCTEVLTQCQDPLCLLCHPTSKWARGAQAFWRRHGWDSWPQLSKGIVHNLWHHVQYIE